MPYTDLKNSQRKITIEETYYPLEFSDVKVLRLAEPAVSVACFFNTTSFMAKDQGGNLRLAEVYRFVLESSRWDNRESGNKHLQENKKIKREGFQRGMA